jgi:signal transduction histidine kinase
VVLAKHFFEHRYDYREEWLRFTRTIGSAARTPLRSASGSSRRWPTSPARRRAAAARRRGPPLAPGAQLELARPVAGAAGGASEREFVRFLEASGHMSSISKRRRPLARRREQSRSRNGSKRGAWAGIPLLHSRQAGRPRAARASAGRRPLDWEDFDLFRTAGIQAASYLAEARSQEALANAQRFDEFNRRFAFIMHDIKNLVSQLSLVARNAERHADNPEFRADMIATLQSSVKKMNDLLARLSPRQRSEPSRSRDAAAADVAARSRRPSSAVHPVELFGDAWLSALADPARLEQALAHLVQNAIDASPPGEPVRICCGARGGEARSR